MTEPEQVFEKYVFFSSRKEREVFANVIQTILPMSLDAIDLAYSDNPNETFNHINERTQKILQGHPHPEEIQAMTGAFADGGEFELRGGALSIIISADRYNFELIDSMKRFLSPVFPTCIFRNQYIWGVDLYENYSRELLFETRIFARRPRDRHFQTRRRNHLQVPIQYPRAVFHRRWNTFFGACFHVPGRVTAKKDV